MGPPADAGTDQISLSPDNSRPPSRSPICERIQRAATVPTMWAYDTAGWQSDGLTPE
jgi:hypothetical protein